ncbi:hypothetical protein BC827DRAFT_1158848 [Russula dissimulans]|nr:hypothetical protein BC827DRAFT_1158848 [Russula dissimulans]
MQRGKRPQGRLRDIPAVDLNFFPQFDYPSLKSSISSPQTTNVSDSDKGYVPITSAPSALRGRYEHWDPHDADVFTPKLRKSRGAGDGVRIATRRQGEEWDDDQGFVLRVFGSTHVNTARVIVPLSKDSSAMPVTGNYTDLGDAMIRFLVSVALQCRGPEENSSMERDQPLKLEGLLPSRGTGTELGVGRGHIGPSLWHPFALNRVGMYAGIRSVPS